MNTQEIIAYSVAGILAVSLVGLVAFIVAGIAIGRRLTNVLDQTESFLKNIQEEVAGTLQEAQVALERIEKLSQSTDALIRDDLGPTLQGTRAIVTNVERTTGAVRAAVEGVGRIAAVVSAVAEPAYIATATGKAVKTSSNKIGLLAYGVRMGLNALLHDGTSKQQPISRRESNGTSGQ
jgi:uncharacterized protein YoxC